MTPRSEYQLPIDLLLPRLLLAGSYLQLGESLAAQRPGHPGDDGSVDGAGLAYSCYSHGIAKAKLVKFLTLPGLLSWLMPIW